MPRAHLPEQLTVREPDFYEILQVSRHASTDVIRAAYRVLARSSHPDINGHEDANALMRRLNTAYEELCDPTRRAAYDARLRIERGLRAQRIHAHERLVSSELRRSVAAQRAAPGPAKTHSGPTGRGLLLPALAIITAVLLAVLVTLWVMTDFGDGGPLASSFSPERASPHVAIDHASNLNLPRAPADQPFLNRG